METQPVDKREHRAQMYGERRRERQSDIERAQSAQCIGTVLT